MLKLKFSCWKHQPSAGTNPTDLGNFLLIKTLTLPETNIFAPENGGPLEAWRFRTVSLGECISAQGPLGLLGSFFFLPQA